MPRFSTSSDANDLLAAVERTLTDYRMLTAGDRVLVGVSGGPDSMVLLHLLSRLAASLKIGIGVAHLDHGLRGAAARQDARVVERAADEGGHPCHVGRAHVMKVKRGLGLSLEEAARRVRYAFFTTTMKRHGYTKLALGHQLDDNAEQVLMALLRGTGPLGLSGIAPIRRNCIIRPLITVPRSQIEAYAAREGIRWITDASNRDLRFLRNRIRHRLLPELESAYNPRIKTQLSRLAEMMHVENAWIDDLTEQPYRSALIDRGSGTLTLCAGALRQAPLALARRLVRRALIDLTGSLRRISFSHVQSVLSLLAANGKERSLHLPGGVRVRSDGSRLWLVSIPPRRKGSTIASGPPPEPAEVILRPPFPPTVRISSWGIGMRFRPLRPAQLPRWQDARPHQAYFDADRLSPPLRLRRLKPGDRFTPLGCSGSQKVKKFFIDHHIPRGRRAEIPVLEDRHRIVWLVGQRIDDHVKVIPATSRVLSIEIFLLDNR